MRKLHLLCLMSLIGFYGLAQSGNSFGIKAGANYGGNGDYIASAEAVAESPENNIGYHIGAFTKINLTKLYIRPEIVYTVTKSDYSGTAFDMSKLDVPVLVGYNLSGPLHIFAGPALQYIIDTKFDGVTIEDIEAEYTAGLHLGIGANLGNLGIDVRYERGFNENEITFINSEIDNITPGKLSTRPEQVIISLSLAF